MAEIGEFNTLRVVKVLDSGVYLDGKGLGNIVLPRRDMPENCKPGDSIQVFLYYNAQGRVVATTRTPKIRVGEFAFLKAVSVTGAGAFLDWGLPEHLLAPAREQKKRMELGKSYIVFAYLDLGDKNKGIAASSKLDKFLDQMPPAFAAGQEVDLLICEQTELGYKAIINNSHWGVLYKNEVFYELHQGQQLKGFIKKIREDQKIDLCLHKPGPEKVSDLSGEIFNKLAAQAGFLAVTDTSTPEAIYAMFGVSKKTFKKALGALYKRKLITIEENGIRLSGKNKTDAGS